MKREPNEIVIPIKNGKADVTNVKKLSISHIVKLNIVTKDVVIVQNLDPNWITLKWKKL